METDMRTALETMEAQISFYLALTSGVDNATDGRERRITPTGGSGYQLDSWPFER